MDIVPWAEMTWLNEPPAWRIDGETLVVETGPETDFWRSTGYGFVRDSGHFLGRPLEGDAAIEVTFRGDLSHQFDQAGLMLRAGPETWVKAGAELSDGRLYASAVVTNGMSDWSVAPLQGGARGRALKVRASRSGDAVTVRYRVGEAPTWELLRVAWLPPDMPIEAGLMCCSPKRSGLSVRFESVRVGPPDERLHED